MAARCGASCSTASRAKPIGLKRRCWRLPKARTNPCRCLSSRWISRAPGWSRCSASRPWMRRTGCTTPSSATVFLTAAPLCKAKRATAWRPPNLPTRLPSWNCRPTPCCSGRGTAKGRAVDSARSFHVRSSPKSWVWTRLWKNLLRVVVLVRSKLGELDNRRGWGDLMLVAGGDVEGRSAGRRTGSRIDPLGILRRTSRIYKSAEADGDWTRIRGLEAAQRNSQPVLFRRKKGDGAKAGKPSVDKPRQHRTHCRASWRHLRPCRNTGRRSRWRE